MIYGWGWGDDDSVGHQDKQACKFKGIFLPYNPQKISFNPHFHYKCIQMGAI